MDVQVPLGKRLRRKPLTAAQASRRPVALETPTTPPCPNSPFVRPRPHRPGAPPVLPVRRPQVQQPHEIGFGGLLRGVPARRFHAFFLNTPHVSMSGSMYVPPTLKALMLDLCRVSTQGSTSVPPVLKGATLPAFRTPGAHGPKTPCRTPIFWRPDGPRRPAVLRADHATVHLRFRGVPRPGFEHDFGRIAPSLSNRRGGFRMGREHSRWASLFGVCVLSVQGTLPGECFAARTPWHPIFRNGSSQRRPSRASSVELIVRAECAIERPGQSWAGFLSGLTGFDGGWPAGVAPGQGIAGFLNTFGLVLGLRSLHLAAVRECRLAVRNQGP